MYNFFAKRASYAVNDIGWGTGEMISDLDWSLGSRYFLNLGILTLFNKERIPFTLTFHPHNYAVKSIILKNFKLLQNDQDTGRIFSQPPFISFKRDKNIGNFLVRSVFQTSEQPGTFKCACTWCKTCPFIRNVEKISGPKRSIKITDHFTCTCTSANVIYCITCTLCKKL